jgi:hypothetical protein
LTCRQHLTNLGPTIGLEFFRIGNTTAHFHLERHSGAGENKIKEMRQSKQDHREQHFNNINENGIPSKLDASNFTAIKASKTFLSTPNLTGMSNSNSF